MYKFAIDATGDLPFYSLIYRFADCKNKNPTSVGFELSLDSETYSASGQFVELTAVIKAVIFVAALIAVSKRSASSITAAR